jgi:hypothetical protein
MVSRAMTLAPQPPESQSGIAVVVQAPLIFHKAFFQNPEPGCGGINALNASTLSPLSKISIFTMSLSR